MKSHQVKTDEGNERNEYWRGLTVAQKVADLDRRLGTGVGATRQRTKLLTLAIGMDMGEAKALKLGFASNAEQRRHDALTEGAK